MFKKLFSRFIVGIFLGAAVLFIILVASGFYTIYTSSSIHIPGLIKIWSEMENGMPAIAFDPNIMGFSAYMVVIAIFYSLTSLKAKI